MTAIYNIARTTLGEAIRRRVLLVIILIALACLIIAPGLSVLSAKSSWVAVTSLTLGIIQMTSAVIAIVLTVYMIPNEIERRTIYTILSKPVQRWQFLVGKYLGAVAALGVMIGLMTLVLLIATSINRGFDLSTAQDLVKGPFMYFWQMALLAAVAIMFSTFVTPLVNFFLSGGVLAAGTVFSTVFQSFLENKQTLPLTKAIVSVVQFILPNFSIYNIQSSITNPTQEITNETMYFLWCIGYGLAYIGIVIVIACLIFDQREV